jgi:hypothetical protein
MQSTVCFNKKVDILRGFEIFGYQVAFYLLEDEQLAVKATQSTLLEQSLNDDFFTKPSAVQQQLIKKSVMKSALRVKQQSLLTVTNSGENA